jgi:hypothetical protein
VAEHILVLEILRSTDENGTSGLSGTNKANSHYLRALHPDPLNKPFMLNQNFNVLLDITSG